MFIHERMTKNVVTVKPENTVSKAFQILTENKHAQLPVVDDNGKLVGIITEKLLAEVNPSKATSLSVYEINYLLSKTKVSDIIKSGVFKINQNKLIEDAALIMKDNRIGSLPVVDDDDFLVGIVTRTDIFKAFIEIFGVKRKGVTISIILKDDSAGQLAKISKIIAEQNINIINISNFCSDSKVEMNIKLDLENTENLDNLIEELKKDGHEIRYINKQD